MLQSGVMVDVLDPPVDQIELLDANVHRNVADDNPHFIPTGPGATVIGLSKTIAS